MHLKKFLVILFIIICISLYFFLKRNPKQDMHKKNIQNAQVIEDVIIKQKKCFPEYYKTLQQLEKHDFYLQNKNPYKISKKVKDICQL